MMRSKDFRDPALPLMLPDAAMSFLLDGPELVKFGTRWLEQFFTSPA